MLYSDMWISIFNHVDFDSQPARFYFQYSPYGFLLSLCLRMPVVYLLHRLHCWRRWNRWNFASHHYTYTLDARLREKYKRQH